MGRFTRDSQVFHRQNSWLEFGVHDLQKRDETQFFEAGGRIGSLKFSTDAHFNSPSLLCMQPRSFGAQV